MRSSVDYAGLFPPAGLEMKAAAHNYADYMAGEHSWALGRFIVPASGLEELHQMGADQHWHLSVVVGSDWLSALDSIRLFQMRSPAHIDSIEVRLNSVLDMERAISLFAGLTVYYEIPIREDLQKLVETIGRNEGHAKVRTGGVECGQFPSPVDLSRFIVACASRRIPFKATAGLHHAVRSEHPLTYEPDSPVAMMHGFLNISMASVAAFAGCGDDVVLGILGERRGSSFYFENSEGCGWREWSFSNKHICRTRENFLVSFGSCSFMEPIQELKDLGLL